MRFEKSWLLLVVALVFCSSSAFAGDPPARVARLSYISGDVSIQPNGVNDWVQASINRPLTSSDRIWGDKDSRAELQLGGAALRLDSNTSVTLVNISDNNVQVQIDQGTVNLHIVELYDGEVYEIDTPNTSFIVKKQGDYRFDVDNAGDTTDVTVFKGEGEATGDGPAVLVKKNERYTFLEGKSLRYLVNHNPGVDGFDEWAFARDERQDRAVSARYVSRHAVGYADLDDHGRWMTVAPYGPVWVPTGVAVDWAPYRYGHWVWVSPWGWTWVDDAPWGFAPFHYGRWVRFRNYWGWCPGPIRVRPVYAPALVAWVGGSNWGVGLSFGIGGGVGWFPLGWGEPYIPYYRHSRGYFRHVNVSNTRITNITHITNIYYNNPRHGAYKYKYRSTPYAVTAVSKDVFRGGRPTRGAYVRVSERDMKHARVERGVPFRPTTNSVLGVNAGKRGAAPPAWGRSDRRDRPRDMNANNGRPNGVWSRGPENRERTDSRGGPRMDNDRGGRTVHRPPDRDRAMADLERPRDIPNPGRVRDAARREPDGISSRVPRPPRGADRGQPNGRPHDAAKPPADISREGKHAGPPDRGNGPDRETRSVPRPPDGRVERPDNNRDAVGRNGRDSGPRVREDRNAGRPEGQPGRGSRNEGVARDVRPQGPPAREQRVERQNGPPARQAERGRPSERGTPGNADRSPSEDRKGNGNGRERGAVNYPRPNGNIRPVSYDDSGSSRVNYTRDYESRRSYSRPSNEMSATRGAWRSPSAPERRTYASESSAPRVRSYSAPQRSYSGASVSRGSQSAPSQMSRGSGGYSGRGGHSSGGGSSRTGGSSSRGEGFKR